MSVAALTAAFSVKLGKSSTKSVLVSLADRADDLTGICFPSVADTVERTELDRKTVLSCLKELEKRKFLHDTGKRCGKTNQVKIWRLDLALLKLTSLKSSPNGDGSVFPPKGARFFEQTVPETGYGTTKEPSSNHHLDSCAGGVGGDLNSKTPTPVLQEGDSRENLEDLIAAAYWMENKTRGVRSPAGFKSKVRRRITSEGASMEDWETLAMWRASQKKPCPVENPEESKRVAEKRLWQAEAKRKYAAMEAAQQKEIESRFAMYLQATNTFAYKAYLKSGLESGMVAGTFHGWLVGELQ